MLARYPHTIARLFRAADVPAYWRLGLRSPALPRNCCMASLSQQGQSAAAIDEGDWERLGSFLASYDEQREQVIKRCRDVQKLAKQAIYTLHRGQPDRAGQQLQEAESAAKELLPMLQQHPSLRHGSFAAAMEEYVEAVAFKVFLQEGRLVRSSELPLAEPEEYLGGVLDFTGELNRYAIQRATQRDRAAVQSCRDLVDAVMGRFLQFDLRNSALRRKYDALKYTLKKMENTIYELSLTESTGISRGMGEAPMDEGDKQQHQHQE